MPELLLGDLHRDMEIVQQRRVDVAELMPRHPSEARWLRRLQQTAGLRLTWNRSCVGAEHAAVARFRLEEAAAALAPEKEDAAVRWHRFWRLLPAYGPQGKPVERVRKIRDDIRRRVEALVRAEGL